MSHDCSNKSSCSESHDHSHDHHHHHAHSGCGCCGSCNCDCHNHSNSECHQSQQDFAKQLLQLADEAWMELIKDKIKMDILSKSDAHLTQIARLASSYNHKRWQTIMESKHNCAEFSEELKKTICGHHSN